jgi:GNAT superfamily N-acetyltransferase
MIATIMPARSSESETIARLFRSIRTACLIYLPNLHTPEEDLWFFRERVFREDEVWVAEHDGIVGFVGYRAGWIDHLYVHPGFHGRGIGSDLLSKAMVTYPHLRLWVFQKNAGAIRFYVAKGFLLVKETDGRRNEEREPDALFEWRRSPL